MLTTSENTQPHTVLPRNASTDTPPRVLTELPFSAQEIERICRAFIRLITSGEEQNGHSNKSSPNVSKKTAKNR